MKLCENKIALVTSSTRGIGLACAKKLAEHGAKVYLAVRNLEAGKKAAGEIIAAGGQADVVYFDAGKEETFGSMVDEVVAKEGRIDILVNNYGSTDVKVDFDLLNGDTDSFFKIVENNLKSVYIPSKHAVKSMIQTGGGSIVNISSVGGRYPDLSRTAYGIAKAAINYLTENIAVQYARQGVRCNAVMPGFVATDAAMAEHVPGISEHVPEECPAQPSGCAGRTSPTRCCSSPAICPPLSPARPCRLRAALACRPRCMRCIRT